MINVFRGDTVILTKTMDKLNLVGQTFEVANITEKTIVLRDVKTKVAVGSVAIDDFEEYFVKQEIKGWKPWTTMVDASGNTVGFYRTNGKKVQVRTYNCRAEASCNLKTNDKFDLFFGVQLAYLRCQNKFMTQMRQNYLSAAKQMEGNIRENNHNISQLMTKMYPKTEETVEKKNETET